MFEGDRRFDLDDVNLTFFHGVFLMKKALHVEVCSLCHPFYTGKQTTLDRAGRVDRFKKRAAARKAS